MGATHENSGGVSRAVPGSDRAFGLIFAAVFAVVTVFPVISGGEPRVWSLAVAVAFMAFAAAAPRLLRPLNLLWFRFGLVLHRVVTPLVMGLLFFGAVTPTGLIMRLFGKDPLRLRRQPAAASYWIMRQPPGPAPESMRQQF